MHQDATAAQVDRVCRAIRDLGYEPHPMPGAQRTAVCITGNRGAVPTDTLATLPGIREIIRVSKPYKLVTRDFRPEPTVISFGASRLVGGDELCVIAGPCSVESEVTTLGIAESLHRMGVRFFRAGAYKPRTSPYSFQGLGKEGLEILAKVKREFGLVIVTEVLDTETLPWVAEVADILQVGARNMSNSSLLKRLGQVRKPVLLKRGLAATLDELFMAAEYVMAGGNYRVILCERGIRTISDHSRFTLDLSAIPAIRQASHLPVIADPSHAAGLHPMVEPLALAAVAAGADGLVVEVHDNPASAWCDGPQALTPEQLGALIVKAEAIRATVRSEATQRVAAAEGAA
jgi:3-deoxy-7-phosphoheptulonate synthase